MFIVEGVQKKLDTGNVCMLEGIHEENITKSIYFGCLVSNNEIDFLSRCDRPGPHQEKKSRSTENICKNASLHIIKTILTDGDQVRVKGGAFYYYFFLFSYFFFLVGGGEKRRGKKWGEGFKKMGSGRTNERPGTDHVISRPMRGVKKNCTRWRQTTEPNPDGLGDSMTELAHWGRFSENLLNLTVFQS